MLRAFRCAALAALVLTAVACDDRRVKSPTFVERVVAPRTPGPGASPLLVLLHGIGADENDLLPLARVLDPRLTVVSLRAPRHYQVGYAWFHIDWTADGSVVPDLAQARETLDDLVRWVAAAPARLGTDPSRLYLLGFSQGAMMTLGVLGTKPELLAGVIALSGRNTDRLFETVATSDAIARVPLFVAHGAYDDLLPVANGRAIRDRLQPLVCDFSYGEYAVAHGIADDELRDVAAWLRDRLDRRAAGGTR
jgi:phospholipase/carboxylesterase